MKTFLIALLALLGTSQFALGLANATKLQHTRNSSIENRLLDATGVVRMMDEYNVEQDGSTVFYKNGIKTETCSAIYIQEPAWFITSAFCFADKNGEVDKNRRYARVFVEGKAFTIDPLSIVIHKKYQRGVGTNDLAIFSLLPGEQQNFAYYHNPIPIIPASTWNFPSQPASFVAFGGTNNSGEGFGVPRIKNFVQVYPDPEDINQAGNVLRISPTEQVLAYESSDGVGVNCLYDSGGGAFVEINHSASEGSTLYLQSIIVGKVGPDGNTEAACDEIDRYAVNVDLRYQHGWILPAINEAERNVVLDKAKKDAFFEEQKRFYGYVKFDAWNPTRSETYERFLNTLKPKRHYDKHAAIYLFMKLGKKRMLGRSALAATTTQRLHESRESIEAPPYPWGPLYSDWISLWKKRSSYTTTYVNSDSTTPVGNFRFRNVGATDITFDEVEAKAGYRRPDWDNDGDGFRIKPGEKRDFWFPDSKTLELEEIKFTNYRGHHDIELHAVPAVKYNTMQYDGKNTYKIQPPRMYEIRNDAPKHDVNIIRWIHNGSATVDIRNAKVDVATKRGGFNYTFDWSGGSTVLHPRNHSGHYRQVHSGTDDPAWWQLYGVRFMALGRSETNLALYTDFSNNAPQAPVVARPVRPRRQIIYVVPVYPVQPVYVWGW